MRPLGCCTWIFGNVPLPQIAVWARECGLDGVELFGNVEQINPRQAHTWFGEHGLKIFSLTPADADLSHPDANVRQQAMEYYLRLFDFAVELGRPLVSVHGKVGRIRPLASQVEEDAWLLEALSYLCAEAASRNLTLVYEILNRYETHQIRTVSEALTLRQAVGSANLKLLADAYHMNIEEADPAAALHLANGHLGLYHAADSNRCGIGMGHTQFAAQIAALTDIQYQGPVILEINAPGPDPFTPHKGGDYQKILKEMLSASVGALRRFNA